jgi:HEAT repeat protein
MFELAAQDTRGFSGPASSEAWETLSKGLSDGNAEHRKKAIAAAGTIGPVKEAVEMVVKALQDKDTSVRQAAAVALGEMKSPDAIPALKAALDDNPEVSFTVAKALWVPGDADSSRDIFQAVLAGERKDTPGKMHNAMRDAKHKLSPGQLALMGIKEAAGLFGPASIAIEAVEEAMKEAKKDSGTPGRAMAAGVLATDSDPYALVLLEWALGDGSWAVRLAVAKALGERGTPDTIPKLLPLLSDEHHAVRYMAAASIVRLGAKKAALATD